MVAGCCVERLKATPEEIGLSAAVDIRRRLVSVGEARASEHSLARVDEASGVRLVPQPEGSFKATLWSLLTVVSEWAAQPANLGHSQPMPREPASSVDPAALRAERDPAARAAQATRALTALTVLAAEVSAIRDSALRELRKAGASYAQIADVAGVTRGRVAQVLRRESA